MQNLSGHVINLCAHRDTHETFATVISKHTCLLVMKITEENVGASAPAPPVTAASAAAGGGQKLLSSASRGSKSGLCGCRGQRE